jgi:hypothetical protein
MEKEAAARPATETPVRIPLGRRIGRLFPSLPRWSYQVAAAAALVVVGILIGRNIFSPQTPLTTAQRGPTEAALIPVSDPAVDRAHDYLERSKLLLLGLVNYDAENDDPYALDLPRRKEISRELVTQAADIKGSLTGSGQARLRELIGDLEVILLQIANLEAEQDLEAVEFVQRGVEEKGIFLKIDLTQMARNARGPAPKASGLSDKPII